MKIKVLSYNIHKGRAFFSREKTWHILEEMLNAVHPDIVFLQEFLKEPEAETLLEAMADKMWPHHSFGQNATAGNYNYGNVIISRFPIQKAHNTNISNHILEKRGLLYARVEPAPGRELHLFCTHLDLREQGRRKQLVKIEKAVSEVVAPKDKIIFAGDFNDWNAKLDPLIRSQLHLDESFLEFTGKLILTSPSVFPILPLDRVYYRGIAVQSATSLNERHLRFSSDHLPLIVEFELP